MKTTKQTLSVSVTCPFCLKGDHVLVPLEGFCEWKNGESVIQEAMPDLSPGEREQLMTGICAPCWDETFSDNEEDDED